MIKSFLLNKEKEKAREKGDSVKKTRGKGDSIGGVVNRWRALGRVMPTEDDLTELRKEPEVKIYMSSQTIKLNLLQERKAEKESREDSISKVSRTSNNGISSNNNHTLTLNSSSSSSSSSRL